MAILIKIKCNSAQAHINELGLDNVMECEVVLRGGSTPAQHAPGLPDRLALNCRHCTEGHVVLTRAMIEWH